MLCSSQWRRFGFILSAIISLSAVNINFRASTRRKQDALNIRSVGFHITFFTVLWHFRYEAAERSADRWINNENNHSVLCSSVQCWTGSQQVAAFTSVPLIIFHHFCSSQSCSQVSVKLQTTPAQLFLTVVMVTSILAAQDRETEGVAMAMTDANLISVSCVSGVLWGSVSVMSRWYPGKCVQTNKRTWDKRQKVTQTRVHVTTTSSSLMSSRINQRGC